MLTGFPATYSNLENHPRLIRARAEKPVPKIRLDPKTGLPTVIEDGPTAKANNKKQAPASEESDSEDEDEGCMFIPCGLWTLTDGLFLQRHGSL